MKKWLSLILALTLVACCASAMAWGESNADLYENAIGLLKENKYTEAGKAFATLGGYSDSPRYTMYCSAIVAGEAGFYSTAVENLQSLDSFLDSKLLATYYAGLSWEAAEDYEKAAEVMSGITLYKDVSTRIASYPEKMNARDYRKAEANEQAGKLESALSGFKALGNYQDSAARAEALHEKINARDYAAADQYEQSGKLEEALKGFKALGSYRDSKDRAAAVQTKIDERAATAAEQAKAAAYAAADQAEQNGDFATAYSGFVALGDYSDSAARAAAVQDKGTYAQALQYCMEGKFSQAYTLFVELGEYEDSQDKAYVLGVTNFASVSDRGNGIAAFKFHDLWGLINTTTNAAVSPYWDEIGEFNRFGLARVSKNELFGYINAAGDVVVPCRWNKISGFNEDGLCTVATKTGRDNYYFGLYDSTGKEITPAQWRTLGNSENSAWGKSYNNAYTYTPSFREGKTMVQNADGLYGFIDTSGKLVGKVRWSSISNFSENLAVVVEKNLYGFIDQNGQVVIEPQYADALSFSEGLAGVKKGGLWQFINHHNEVVIQPKYNQVASFSDGKADVYLNGTGWQIIDSSGGLVYFVNEKMATAYHAAKEKFEAGRYAEAYAEFLALDNYKDSNKLANEAGYQEAKKLQESGQYEEAIEAFTALADYNDSKAKIVECQNAIQERAYQAAKGLQESGKYQEAIAAFTALGDYKDSKEQIAACQGSINEPKYQKAIELRKAGKYEEAIAAFTALGNYSNSETELKETKYRYAEAKIKAKDYVNAYMILSEIKGYRNVDSLLQNKKLREPYLHAKYAVGTYVTFGHYPQTSGGNDNTSIEWLVLARDGNKALLLSRYGLDTKPYNEKRVDITWEKCTLRTWLNGTFLNKAFTTQEQKGILTTSVDNSKSQGYSEWSTNGGNNTRDKVFLLSYTEANKYLGVTYDFGDNTKSRVTPTAYAIKQGAYTSEYNTAMGMGKWWLRSPGIFRDCAATVWEFGSLYESNVFFGGNVVRPALWINLESDIF